MSVDSMNRTPPASVRHELRAEVGFGCPVEGCGCPLLEFHHFDPPWRELEHHNPSGMIALCATHHGEADAYTRQQCREMKANGRQNAENTRWKFKWRRNEILLLVGSNWFYRNQIAIQSGNQPVVWFTRDDDGYLLLNVHMLTTSGEARAEILDNEWVSTGNEADIEAPPLARKVKISYPNGDMLKVEFNPLDSFEEAQAAYPPISESWNLQFPLVVVEVEMNVANSPVRLNSRETAFATNRMMGCFVASSGGPAVQIPPPHAFGQNALRIG
ncbi:MAG: hypothetical protein VKJ04_02000 [Vampirovibrionales bacterium]|nr:hypothetical protein [Vampirovibrionales bacterium]